MKQRPVGELVNALRDLSAEIIYLEKENFPPLKIKGKKIKGGKIEIDGSVSSQFISALLLISPTFENGLELTLKNDIVSWPYIQMTIDLLKEFGIEIETSGNLIALTTSSIVNRQSSIKIIESDWSSASYWYSICALSKNSEIKLNYLNEKSLQADSVLPKLYDQLGVTTIFKNGSVLLSNKKTSVKEFNYDFTDCPDIAQTIAVTCFSLGIKATLTGLKTLKLKESDRIVALKTELEKFGASIEITAESLYIFETKNKKPETKNLILETYKDHRMAMSFAPLALVFKVLQIKDPEVVSKSYPLFWEDLKSVGFSVNLQP